MGETVYAQVSFVRGTGFESYAESVVPRVLADERNNVVEVQTFSRPIPYPYDWESWLVANVEDAPSSQEQADNAVDTDEPATEGVTLKTEAEIAALTSKAAVISYAESIGLSGLTTEQSLTELRDAVVKYQRETYGA